MNLSRILLFLLLPVFAFAEWGVYRTEGFVAWVTPYSNRLPAPVSDAIAPSVTAADSGAIVIIEPAEADIDAVNVTLRYKTDTGVYSRTQTISNNGRGQFGALFKIGPVTPLSLSIRAVIYSSVEESR